VLHSTIVLTSFRDGWGFSNGRKAGLSTATRLGLGPVLDSTQQYITSVLCRGIGDVSMMLSIAATLTYSRHC